MKGRCPRCGQGRLFKGWLAFADECAACGLDFRMEDAGDGPSFFVLLFGCFVLVPLGLVFHAVTGERLWLTAIVVGGGIVFGSIALLRPMRGAMFAQQWKTNALEATRKDLDE